MPPKGSRTSTSAAAKSRSSASTPASTSTQSPLSTLYNSYVDNTPKRLKVVDAFLVFLMLSGIIQFVYCALITNFPFNSFIAGFASTVGQFVLAASLRIQANPENGKTFPKVSPERAFGDFLFGSVILHFFVFNFLG
ncbi:related to apoptotic cell death regulator DAD1 [Sporisorium reilianum f. sp. reilianum]|uniref:Dolichyl-diphosphooligosaccharide--protein glycosyltransferase subunit OST2 n=1 Tax=Sporisorium reilianum f. sp. reilianum TaxID=72559 RepID=A0A2N8UK55_9BASI|nr:related to apoptotic cell death regulator DAD1 [Sporisorium reilianum f. sp. reilianum]